MPPFGNPFKSNARELGKKTYRSPESIEAEIPYLDLCGRLLIDSRACAHAFYEIDAPAADVASSEQLEKIRDTVANMMDVLPDKVFQIQFNYSTSGDYRGMIVSHAGYESSFPVADGLRRERAEMLLKEAKQGKLIRAGTVMVLGVLPPEGGSLSAANLSMAGTGKVSMKERVMESVDFLAAEAVVRTAEGMLTESFSKIGIKVRSMSSEAIAEYLYRLFNPGLANKWGVPSGYDYDIMSLNATWLRGEFYLDKKCIDIGDYSHAFVSMNTKPQGTLPRIIEKLTTDMGFNDFRTCITFRRLDRVQELEGMKRHMTKTLARMRNPLNIIDRIMEPHKKEDIITAGYNVDAAEEANEAKTVIADLRTGRDYLIMMQAAVHLWSDDAADLDNKRSLVAAAMADMNKAKAWAETKASFDIFKQNLPGSSEPQLRWCKVVGKMAADMVPLHRGFEGGDAPRAIFRNRTGGLVSLDLSHGESAKAPISFVAGKTGSGKSFLVNQLIMQHLEVDGRVMIMDVGGSYIPLVNLLGGQVIEFVSNKKCCMNPLQMFLSGGLKIPSPEDRGKMCRCIESLMLRSTDPEGELPPKIMTVVKRAVEGVFDDAHSQGTGFVTLTDLAKKMSVYPDGAEPVERLQDFLKGGLYGDWFDGPTTIDASSRVVCFDLAGVKQDARLCAALAPIIVSYIHDMVMTNRRKPKILVMDEMWKFIRQKKIVEFIMEAWKTFRKENTTTIGISQNIIGDIASNPTLAGAILQSTETWFLLEQGGDEFVRDVGALLNLTDGQIDLLSNLREAKSVAEDGTISLYREALMLRAKSSKDANSGIIRIKAMPSEYWIFTTKPNEAALMEDVTLRFGGDVYQAARFLGAKYPGGLDLFDKFNIITGKASIEGVD